MKYAVSCMKMPYVRDYTMSAFNHVNLEPKMHNTAFVHKSSTVDDDVSFQPFV